jgi:hypothetical protein
MNSYEFPALPGHYIRGIPWVFIIPAQAGIHFSCSQNIWATRRKGLAPFVSCHFAFFAPLRLK